MADKVLPGPVENQAVCHTDGVHIHTNKIYDACRDKDCIEDLRVYPTVSSQCVIDSAFSVRPDSAELICADISVDEISFNRGYYTVDVTYFYKVTGQTFPGGCEVRGLAVFDKRVILFGSEGSVKTFRSDSDHHHCGRRRNDDPLVVVEAVDPIALSMRIADADNCACGDPELRSVPADIVEAIGEDIDLGMHHKKLYVTLGQFSIIRLERDTQLTLENVDYFFPDKECMGSCSDDPCTLFGRVRFPVEEFIPPDILPTEEDYKSMV
ncbi:MAG: hypothetical protein ACI4PC_06815 [Oscillospiraceae bacterium]